MTDPTKSPAAEPPVIVPQTVELIDHRPATPTSPPPERRFRARKRRALVLFVLTCLSTYSVFGLGYAVPLMLILVAHELGHYLQAVRYRVPASLPYFIPMPLPPFGTMGAIIFQGRGYGDRKAMFDIAISGPLAGLVLALPITYFGIRQSSVEIVPPDTAMLFGEPLIFQWFVRLVHGPVPEGYELAVTPLAYAGWVGLFITAFNLIPIGQLDGGHILYTLIGKRAHPVAILLLVGQIGYMVVTRNPSYALIVLLLILTGPKHPPTADDTVPLGWPRIVLGWLTLAFLFIGFTPTPIVTP